jgi:rhodanese-related sulfurtransferase
MRPDKRELSNVVFGAIVLALVGTAAGLAFNRMRPSGLSLNATGPLCPPAQAKYTTLDAAAAAFGSKAAVFVDARTPEEYATGHIPGAIDLPLTDFDSVFPALREQLARAPGVITYCDGPDCRAAEYLGDRLLNEGLESVEVLPEGFLAWEAAGYPVAVGDVP